MSALGDVRNRSRRLTAAVGVMTASQAPIGPTDVRGRSERQKNPRRNGRGPIWSLPRTVSLI